MLTWTGVSWRTASSARRAELASLVVPGAVAIHTCARDAWLTDGEGPSLPGFAAERLHGRDAVARFLAVACGLDSAVQGEADVGRQVRAALAASDAPIAPTLDHVLARLLRRGRLAEWIREGEGVATLAARAIGPGSVAIVGAGAMGERVARLVPRAVVYNRTLRPGVRALTDLAPADTWVVATSAPAAWFRPPGACALVLDLGHPAQAIEDPRRVSLDALLAGADARLSPDLLASALDAVRIATDDVLGRLPRAA